MIDRFKTHYTNLSSPAEDGLAVTPSDDNDLETATRGINVAASGAVKLTTVNGTDLVVYIAAGTVFPIRAQRIWSTGTAATGIVALF